MSCCCCNQGWLDVVLEDRAARLEEIVEAIVAAGPKEKAALKSLDDAIAKLKAWQAAQDETDASELNARVEEINTLTGGSTTVNPSVPVDAVTGANVPTPPAENNPEVVGQSEDVTESSDEFDQDEEEAPAPSGDPFSRNA